MKPKLDQLPLEVWADVFRYPWKSREEMGRIVDRIGNYKFAVYFQFYLHDWGRRELEPIYFLRQQHPNIPFKAIPQTPVPSNIKSFKLIQINHVDQQTVDFLQHISPLLAAADTAFDINGIQAEHLFTLRAILDHMVPLLGMGSSHSLKCDMLAVPTVGQCFDKEKLTTINWIEAESYGIGMSKATQWATVNSLRNWLALPQQQGGGGGGNVEPPKWCKLIVSLLEDNGFSEQICAAIREDFLAAKSPATFALFIHVHPLFSQSQFAEFHEEKKSAGEELNGVKLPERNSFRITRHKANCGTEMQAWIEESQAKGFNSRGKNQIAIQNPTIESIGAMDVPEDVREEDQSSSSSSSTPTIHTAESPTIGSIDAMDAPEGEADQPSTAEETHSQVVSPTIDLPDTATMDAPENLGEEENQQQSAPIIQIERGLMNWNYIFPLAMDIIKHLFI